MAIRRPTTAAQKHSVLTKLRENAQQQKLQGISMSLMIKVALFLATCYLPSCGGFGFSTPRKQVSLIPVPMRVYKTQQEKISQTMPFIPSTVHVSSSRLNLSLLPFTTALPQFPLISPTDTWGNIAAMTSTAAIAQFLGKSTRVGRLLGPPVTAMALAFIFASTGLLAPGGTASAKALQLLCLQLATPLLLLGADLRDCASRCGPLLQAFFCAAFATLIASTVGWHVCKTPLQRALGKDGLIIAAALMAKNIGGGINYIAVCRALSASPPAVAAGLCVDNLFALVYFPITSALSAGRPDLFDEEQDTDTHSSEDEKVQDGIITVEHASIALSLAAITTWLGERLGGTMGALPCCTLITVLFASRAPVKFLQSIQPAAHVLGTCCLYLFFATAGAPGLAVAESVRNALIPVGSFLSILYAIHGIILTLCYRWAARRSSKSNNSNHTLNKSPFVPQRLVVASSAAIGGPATAAALAQANGWNSLVAPSLLVGNIGYAMATFIALAFVAICSR